MEQKNPGSLANLALAKYRINCRAREKVLLPPYKGSALHGGFGFALEALSPFYYKKICQARSGPNPLILLPPLDTDVHYPPGHAFSFELTLTGNATDYFQVCRDAVEHLGNHLGFGNNRGKFEIISIESAIPPNPNGTTTHTPSIKGDAISSRRWSSNHDLTLHFVTPLRLKTNDRLLLSPPPFSIFFARLVGRLNSLAIFHGDGAIISPEYKRELLELAEQITITKDETRRRDMSRFSTRQKQWMKFDGLTGRLFYSGNFELFSPYLVLGEWTHVGGKTSFGLGKYVMEASSEPTDKGV